MPPQTLEDELDSLRKRVTKLERLPARIDALTLQVSQLRAETRDEFSAVRGGMQQLRDDLTERIDQQGLQMHALHEDVLGKIHEQGMQMRVLHEDVIGRIALLAEGSNRRGAGGRKRKR